MVAGGDMGNVGVVDVGDVDVRDVEVEVILAQACDRELTFGTMIDSEQELRMHASASG